jgi:hypothetical protein
VVNESGQIYTIEGLAAGVLMVVTAYLIVSTTTVFTQQDVHITDMQLEQMGNDALAMMDTPNVLLAADGSFEMSDLERNISLNKYPEFKEQFLGYVNGTTGESMDNFKINASLFYRNDTGINSYAFGGDPYYREDAVKVSRWVYLPNFDNSKYPENSLRDGTQSVLVEVLLWRE